MANTNKSKKMKKSEVKKMVVSVIAIVLAALFVISGVIAYIV